MFPEWETDRSGRVCAVDLLCHGDVLRVVSVHAPNDPAERKVYFDNLAQYIDTPAKVVVGGDFNCILNAKDSSQGLRQDSSMAVLRKLFTVHDLQDVTGAINAPDPGYTHWQGNCHSRLDRVYASSDIAKVAAAYHVEPLAFSDHALVAVRFGKRALTRQEPCWQSWKLNESLLDDDEVVKEVKGLIKNGTEKQAMNAVDWELLKEEIKMKLISVGQKKARKKKSGKETSNDNFKNAYSRRKSDSGIFWRRHKRMQV